jgi:hypothetical protein
MNPWTTEMKLLWASGLIEGEGCFILSKDKRSNYHKTAIQVEMTDLDTLEQLKAILGGTIIESNYPSKFKNHPNAKFSWRWYIHKQKEVFDCLLKIMPYLKARRLAKAQKLFNYLEPKIVG